MTCMPCARPHDGAGKLLAEERRLDLAVRVLEGEEAVAGRRKDGWLTSPSTQTSARTASASRSPRTRRLRSVTRRMRGLAPGVAGGASASVRLRLIGSGRSQRVGCSVLIGSPGACVTGPG